MATTPTEKTEKTKSPPLPKADRFIQLFAKNIEKIRLHYHRENFAGPQYGFNTTMEAAFAHISVACTLAQEGKEWEPL